MSLALLERPAAPSPPKDSLARRRSPRIARSADPKPRQRAMSLSSEEERSLAERIARGDRQAVERMVLANLGLVCSIARSYMGVGLSFEDLKQEGTRGLIRACSDFDPKSHDVRFSTYASYWVRNAIQLAIASSASMIRLPSYMVTLRSKYRRALRELDQQEPSDSGAGGASSQRGSDAAIASRLGISLDTLGLVRLADIERTHFHRGPGGEDSVPFEETLADSSQPLFDLDSLEEMDCLREGIELLSPVEAWVIRQRFGIEDPSPNGPEGNNRRAGSAAPEPRTVTWIARSFSLSPSTVRRYEQSALAKLKEHMQRRIGGEE